MDLFFGGMVRIGSNTRVGLERYGLGMACALNRWDLILGNLKGL